MSHGERLITKMKTVDEVNGSKIMSTGGCTTGTNPTLGVYGHEPTVTPDRFEPLLTAEEAAQHLRIHVKTVQKLAREQRIPCVRLGKYWRFRLSALDAWVTAQHNQIQPAVFA